MSKKHRILAISGIFGLLIAIMSLFFLDIDPIKAYFYGEPEIVIRKIEDINLVTIQGNTLISISDPNTEVVEKRINVVMTGYSSCPAETDSTPFITASGKFVEDGIVANNLFPFGTKIRIPELYGDKVFVVEDRMHWRKGYYHVDIWFPEKEEALDFGSKRTYIEVLES
jgi:3D (Asp-Asp-Asp) domain-containing protein